jgi:fibronectin type 3 domain-containing protein
VAQTTSSILVSWDASTDSSGISAYKVFRDNGATAIATIQTTSYTDASLAADTSYSYTVQAVDAAPAHNECVPSAAATARTLIPADTTPPSIPTNVTAEAQSTSSILVSWNASTDSSGISGYKVFRDNGATAIATVQTTS